jgi:predicted DsbA family dithiol-disulfide isomerase
VRTRLLQDEFKDKLIVDWRAFMLRPEPRPGLRSLEKFRAYTQNWLQVGSEEDSGNFRTWSTDENPPSHSIPPHLVAKAAAKVGEDAFERIHFDLLHAYFFDNRDISNIETLRQIWDAAGLSASQFEVVEDPDIRAEVISEHQQALDCGATGAPAFRMSTNDLALTGAHAMPLFRRWINKELERLGSA